MGEQNLARGSHLPGLEREDKSQDSGGGRRGSGGSCGGIWASGCHGRGCSTLSSFQKWRNGEQVRGITLCTGEGNLENFFLSSLDGPSARESGQEVLKLHLLECASVHVMREYLAGGQKLLDHQGYTVTVNVVLKTGDGAEKQTLGRGSQWAFPPGLLTPLGHPSP